MKMHLFAISAFALLCMACERHDRPTTPQPPQTSYADQDFDSTRTAAPNTAVTPFDQSESQADLNITQRIRQALVNDGALSTNAKNIKIITIKGVVTLRGAVANNREKEIIAQKLNNIQGIRRVDNQLEVRRNGY